MPLAGVDDEVAEAAGRRQQPLDLRDGAAQLGEIHPRLIRITAGGTEVALHIDDQQRPAFAHPGHSAAGASTAATSSVVTIWPNTVPRQTSAASWASALEPAQQSATTATR